MSENVAGATPALSEADLDVVVEAAHPSRPDRYDLTRQHVERLMADAVAAALAPVERLRALSEAATPGEWRQEFYRDGELLPDGTGSMDDHETPGSGVYVIDEASPHGYCLTEFSAGSSADAAFIVAAVNAVRAALAEGKGGKRRG